MIIRRWDAPYVQAVVKAIEAGTLPASQLTKVCPECGLAQDYLNNDEHLVALVDEGVPNSEVAVIIGCEGAWVVDPATVGINAPGWQDWRMPA